MRAEVFNRLKQNAASPKKGWSRPSFVSPLRQISTKMRLVSLNPSNGMMWFLRLGLPGLSCKNANVGTSGGKDGTT